MSPSAPTRQTRFGRKAVAPGGLTLATAVAGGEKRLAGLRTEGLERIDQLLADLASAAPGGDAALDGAALRRCETAAAELAGLGGLFGLPVLGRIAGQLCETLAGHAALPSVVVTCFTGAAQLARAHPDRDLTPVMQELQRLLAKYA